VEPWSGSTALKCQSQGRDNEFTCRHQAAYWLLRRRPLIVSELLNWRHSVCSASFVFSTRRTLNSRWSTAQKDGPDDVLRIRWIRISNLGPETRLWCFRNFVQSFHVNMKFEVRLPDQPIGPYNMEPTSYFYRYEIGHDVCCSIGVIRQVTGAGIRVRDVPLLQNTQTGSGATQPSLQWVPGFFPRVKWPGRDVDSSPP